MALKIKSIFGISTTTEETKKGRVACPDLRRAFTSSEDVPSEARPL
jgi:hypothetical protein